MAFKGGDENINRAGKKPGTLNKSTKLIKEAFGKLLEDNLDNMTQWVGVIAAEDPAKAMDLMLRMSERFVPKLRSTEITGADGEDLFKNVKFEFGPGIGNHEGRQTEDFDLDNL